MTLREVDKSYLCIGIKDVLILDSKEPWIITYVNLKSTCHVSSKNKSLKNVP